MKVFPNHKTIRLGVWGLGRGMHIQRVCETLNFKVVAGCDFNPHFEEHFRKAHPDAQFTADAETFLKMDFDAVLLATFCPEHAQHSILCLQAGKHVLSEVTAFHTPAEAVALVEAAEKSGLVYQLAENYPYSPQNRFLAQKWSEGLFGEFQYAEYSYIHDCLHYAYLYIDHTPVSPGWTVHNWRSWLPWHFYNTHSLGPVMTITGRRPVKVVALPSRVNLHGQLLRSQGGLSGVAPSLIEFDNGGLMRNLMGGTTNDIDFKLLYGTRASSEHVYGDLYLRMGGRGDGLRMKVHPPLGELDQIASSTGHGGGDFWVLYHFAREILEGIRGPFDVYNACDVTLPGILAYRSSMSGGQPQIVPDFRDAAQRELYRNDHAAPPRFDTRDGVFPPSVDRALVGQFTSHVKALLEYAQLYRQFSDWAPLCEIAETPARIVEAGEKVLCAVPDIIPVIHAAQKIIAASPDSVGASVLKDLLGICDADELASGNGVERLRTLLATTRTTSITKPA
ncbi:MAG: Gfo/Idh/MocA family oxidoreductase [Verrucomicrobiota bacterium]|nr:Gfo/Idh/MocA family oxidoreductase [Verrucomicrobiota bacterium]